MSKLVDCTREQYVAVVKGVPHECMVLIENDCKSHFLGGEPMPSYMQVKDPENPQRLIATAIYYPGGTAPTYRVREDLL